MSLVVLGTVALDTVKTPYGFRKDLLGGSAVHFSMSASFFTQVHLAAVIGEDFPEKNLELLKRKKILLDSLMRKKGCTFRWEGKYNKNDLNTACTLNTELGVISDFMPTLSKRQINIKNVFLANYDPDIQYEFLKSMKRPEFVGLDSMNLWIHNKRKSLKRLLKYADILIINDTEAKDLSYEDSLLEAAKCLCSYGPRMIIIKKGEHGCLYYSKNDFFVLPAYPIDKVIDPTGAGDTFAGAVMGYLVKSKRINKRVLRLAVAYGTIISSFNVQGFGLERTVLLKKSGIEKRLKVYKKFFLF